MERTDVFRESLKSMIFFRKSDLRSEARRALRAGDYRRAGDQFKVLGDYEAALAAYLQGQLFEEAALLCQEMEAWERAARYWALAHRYREAAEAFLKAGQWDNACQMFEKARDFGRAKYIALQLRRFDQAGVYAEKIRQYGEAAHYYFQAGLYQEAVQNAERARKELEAERKEREYQPEWRRAYQAMLRISANAYARLGQWHEAGERYEQFGDFTRAREAYQKARDMVKALEMCIRLQDYATGRQIIETHPEARTALSLCGEVYFHLGEYGEAAKYFMAANQPLMAALAFERMGRYSNAAFLYEQAMEYERAIELYERAGQWEKVAQVYFRMGNPVQAARAYERAEQWERAFELYRKGRKYYDAGRVAHQREQIDSAIDCLQRVERHDPDYEAAMTLLCQIWIERGMANVALRKLDDLIETRRSSDIPIEFFYLRGRAWEALERFPEAIQAYETVMAIDMDYADTVERLQTLRTRLSLMDQKAEGTAVQGRFDVLDVIAEHTGCRILKAIDQQRNTPALIQVTPGSGPIDDGETLRRRLQALAHRSVAVPYEVIPWDEGVVLCIDYTEAEPLSRWCQKRPSLERIQDVALQIAQAMAFLHRADYVLGQISPEHVLITPDNGVKILPWDRWLKVPPQSEYTAPEWHPPASPDPKCDIYSFGILLYEMIAGRRPEGSGALPNDIALPEAIRILLLQCLDPIPSNRPPSMDTVVETLATADVYEGAVIDDRYEVQRMLGSGGMGRVFLAFDRVLKETIALKVLHADALTHPVAVRHLMREIRVARRISHPNVVRMLEIGIYRGARYITMEYVDGVSLDTIVRRTGSIPLPTWWKLAVQILEGLHAAHRVGIVHRDLKPQNIMVTRTGRVKILDFGIATVIDSREFTQGRSVLGSPKYMAPEQIQGEPADERTDIYALGAIFYFMLTGREAFTGDTVQAILMKQLMETPPPIQTHGSSIPSEVNDLVMQMLAKRPEDRPPDASVVLARIRALQPLIGVTPRGKRHHEGRPP